MKTLNTDDIFLRNLSISLLELLNSLITLDQSKDDTRETFNVPFQYNFGNDEQFLKDFYIGLPDDCNIPIAEGTYDIIPRGVINLDTFQIVPSDITNRFVRGSYTETGKNDQGENELTGYSAQLYSLPFHVVFDVKIITASLNQAFKIIEQIVDLIYAHRVMYFRYKGLRIPAQFTFPETETVDRKYSFSYADSNKLHVNFKADVETYFPSFESTSKRLSSNIMERLQLNLKDEDGNPMDTTWKDQNDLPEEPSINS